MDKKIMDIVYGSAAFGFSVFCFVYLIPVHVKTTTSYAVGPATFPRLSALLIGFAGMMLVLTRLWEMPDKKAVFQKENYGVDKKHLLRQAVFVAAMIAYILLIPVLGFVFASCLFVFAMLYYFGSRALVQNAVASVVFSILVYYLFSKLFQVGLPSGLAPF